MVEISVSNDLPLPETPPSQQGSNNPKWQEEPYEDIAAVHSEIPMGDNENHSSNRRYLSNDPSLPTTVNRTTSKYRGSRKRSYDSMSNKISRVAAHLHQMKAIKAIDGGTLNKASRTYDRFNREDLILHVKSVSRGNISQTKACMAYIYIYDRFIRDGLFERFEFFLDEKTVAGKLERLDRDIEMYERMLKNDLM